MNETNVVENVTSNEHVVETSAPKLSKKQRKAQRKAKLEAETSKLRRRAFSTVAVKSKRYVVVATDKKGAETYSCGRIETSRTAKINAVLYSKGAKGATTAEVQEALDKLYGKGMIKAVSNHLRTMLMKGACKLIDGRYVLIAVKGKGKGNNEGALSVSEVTETSEASK